MASPTAPPTLGSDDILKIRTEYIQDLYQAADPDHSPDPIPLISLNRFNDGNKANFVSDDTLQSISDRVWNREVRELGDVYDDAYAWWYQQRLLHGDEDADAVAASTTFATTRQMDLLFQLIAKEVFSLMLMSPKFDLTLNDGSNGMALMLQKLEERSTEQVGEYKVIRMVRR